MATTTVTSVVIPKPLVKGVLLSDSAPISPGLYRVPDDVTAAAIRSMTVHNTDDVDEHELSIYLVGRGDAPDTPARVYRVTLAAKATLPISDVYTLAPGDYISAEADEADVVSFRADGSEATVTVS